MNKRSAWAAFALGFLLAPAPAQIWNSVAGWSTNGNQGANGWYYVEYEPERGGSYLPLTWVSQPGNPDGGYWQGSMTWTGLARTWQNADRTHAVRSWVAPVSGMAQITRTGPVQYTGTNGDGVVIRILRNRYIVLARKLGPEHCGPGLTQFTLDATIAVNAGDVLAFHLDPYINSGWDSAVFNPIITLTPGDGYNAAPRTWTSSTQFSSVQGGNNWHYLAAAAGTSNYVPMTWYSNGSYWEWGEPGSWCRVFATTQHPGWSHDSVRAWRADQDGEIHIASRQNISVPTWSPGGGDGTVFSVLHGGRVLWSKKIGPTNRTGYTLAVRTHVRAGDWIYFRLSSGPTGNSLDDHLIVDVDVVLVPAGIPVGVVAQPQGDVVVTGPNPVEWRFGHYTVRGNIRLRPGGNLRVEHATVELLCTKSREFNIYWEGGRLETRDAIIGGARDATGTVYHCNFEIHDGEWISTDTVVRHTYGQIFGYNNLRPRLSGVRHMAGPNSDAVIMTGSADVRLQDSTYPIALSVYPPANGATADLTLPVNQCLTTVFDGNNVPGAPYRLDLVSHQTPVWFLFVNSVSTTPGAPITTMLLRNCPSVYAAVSGNDLVGTFTLPCIDGGSGPLPPQSQIVTGNVVWQTLSNPAGMIAWSLYVNGPATSLVLPGPTEIGELMIGGGRVTLTGTSGTFNAQSYATTIEVGMNSSQSAELWVRNGALGHFFPGSNVKGQITARGTSRVFVQDTILAPILAITENAATIDFCNVTNPQNMTPIQNGGPITISQPPCPEPPFP